MTATRRPRLVLHIGTHKTGTTSLQKAMARARTRWAQAGVLYPATHRPPGADRPKHSSVWHAAAQGTVAQIETERQAVWAEFEASHAHTLVLSAEGLSEPVPRIAEFFVPWQDRFDLQIVCLLRRPDLFVESLYSQFTREPARREHRPFTAFLALKFTQDRLHYHRWLSHWRHTLPGSQMTVLNHDTLHHGGASLSQAFCQATRLPPLPEAAGGRRHNISPDLRAAQVLAAMHRQDLDCDIPRLIAAAKQLEGDPAWPRQRQLLTHAQRQALLTDLADDAEALARDFGVRFEPPDLTGPEPAVPPDQLPQDYLLALAAALSQPPAAA